MDFTSHDILIIERALRAAIKHEEGDSRASEYREVLVKLQENAKQALAPDERRPSIVRDGVRYDYDDSSDLL